MRNVIYILLIVLISGCQKEDALKPNLEYDHLYVIEDDPSDPVKHRVYEIYKQYDVPVYFNDTIGKIFMKNNIHGNPVYRYETLDLGWSFTSYSNTKYHYEYMIEAEERMKALDIIENYLKLASKALYPYNFFVVKSASTEDTQGGIKNYKAGDFVINFRSLLMTGDWVSSGVEGLPADMRREMVKNKIMNYKDLLSAFNNTSKAEWYDVSYKSLNPNHFDALVVPNEFEWKYETMAPPEYYFGPGCFETNWWGAKEFTLEGLENFRAAVRLKIGLWGFVSSGYTGGSTPIDTEHDLTAYISEMLNYSREEFGELWGASPLVMKKYDILYEIVANELGVEL